jgi:hypothetical protein
MPELPESDWLFVPDARSRALATFADQFADDVERTIVEALYDGKIESRGRCPKYFGHNEQVSLERSLWDPALVRVQWRYNRFERVMDGKRFYFLDVHLRRRDFDKWLGQAAARNGTPNQTSAGEITEPIKNERHQQASKSPFANPSLGGFRQMSRLLQVRRTASRKPTSDAQPELVLPPNIQMAFPTA